MKTNYHFGAVLLLAVSLTFSSCQENKMLINDVASKTEDLQDIELARLDFSKALAQSMKESQVRKFIKDESLKQFDGDYDILYSFVKDKPLENGETFEKVLSKYSSLTNFAEVSSKLPLLTVFVPSLSNFSAESWKINSQIPEVAVDMSHTGNKSKTLVAFKPDLTQTEIDAIHEPTTPTLVVKENERVIAKSKTESKARKDMTIFEIKSNKAIKENKTHTFYFIGDVNPRLATVTNKRTAANRPVPSTLQFYQYHKQGWENEPGLQRDWVYYRIWPKFNDLELVNPNINGGVNIDWSKGSLGGTYYTERLTKFKFVSPQGLQSVSEQWSEGVLEFHVVLSFMHRDGGITNDLKVFYCSLNQLKDANNNPIEFDPDVELMLWDVNRYGDEWKLTMLEHDNGGSTTKTISAKSTFGSNFEANASWEFVVKLGVKWNGSWTNEKNSTEQITISSESDQLGDVRFLYDNPILTSGDTRYAMSSGAVNVSIEPVPKVNDPRLYPYID